MVRSINYIKQVKLSIVFKVITVLISFLLVPLMISYLGKEQYGIWVTCLSIISWMYVMDFGILRGSRNKIAEAYSYKNYDEIKKYVSTSYILLIFIAISIILIFLLTNNFIIWQKVFNTTTIDESELKIIITTTFFIIAINFVFSFINEILNSFQKASLTLFIQLMYNFLFLASLLVMINLLDMHKDFYYFVHVYGFSMLLPPLVFSIIFFKKHQNIRPSYKLFEKEKLKSMLNLGSKFLILQFAYLIMYTTDRFIIIQLFSPEEVTNYDVVLKLFSIILVGSGIIMSPLWSAYTEAYEKKDLKWIINSLKKQTYIVFLFMILSVILAIFSFDIIRIWIGDNIEINLSLVICFSIFVSLSIWNNIFATFLNGISKIKLQMYISIFICLINIPISIYLAKYIFGNTTGVLLGTIISISLFSIISPIQVFKVIKKIKKENNNGN